MPLIFPFKQNRERSVPKVSFLYRITINARRVNDRFSPSQPTLPTASISSRISKSSRRVPPWSRRVADVITRTLHVMSDATWHTPSSSRVHAGYGFSRSGLHHEDLLHVGCTIPHVVLHFDTNTCHSLITFALICVPCSLRTTFVWTIWLTNHKQRVRQQNQHKNKLLWYFNL